jgi:cytochrome c-type biogenesis protein CcmH
MKKLILILALLAGPALAVQPNEVLDDPVLEERARIISKGLRCPVCQNESIDESNAPISADLRLLVRERLVAGDTNQEVVDFVVYRYGEFVLLNPTTSGLNIILWGAAPVMLLIGLGVGWGAMRRRPTVADADLTDAEKQRLEEILDQ